MSGPTLPRITLAYGEHLAGSIRGVPRSPPA
jgi:hypothetical protein